MNIISNNTTDVDYLRIYFGDPYVINDKITLKHPRLSDIIEYGEKEYWSFISSVTAIPSDFKPELEDQGIDYEKLSDLEMFHMMTATQPPEKTGIIFGDLDLTKLKLYKQTDNDELVLYDAESGLRIDKRIHMMIQGFLTTVHGIKKKPEFAGNIMTKRILIDDDRQRKKLNAKKPWKSTLMPLISSMINSAGFKYNLSDVRSMPLFPFMDSVARISAINTSNLLLQGAYAGRVDMSKVDKKSIDWSRDLYAVK